MIRKRIPAIDDNRIYFLIKKELLPITHISFPNVQFDQKETRERLDRGITFVLVNKKKPILGFINVFAQGSELLVDMLAIDSKQQGKGWGTSLLETAEKYGRDLGCIRSSLYVDKRNRKARRFYVRRGYKKVQYNSVIKCNLMSKSLV
jgi:ribosomal protein S18 acetylase RimI-like enzyme